jgi:hypothetical protein
MMTVAVMQHSRPLFLAIAGDQGGVRGVIRRRRRVSIAAPGGRVLIGAKSSLPGPSVNLNP